MGLRSRALLAGQRSPILFFSVIFLQTDLHLHCREWDELLNSGEWEPEQITAKLPEFFRFVKEVQRFVLQEMRTKTDQ